MEAQGAKDLLVIEESRQVEEPLPIAKFRRPRPERVQLQIHGRTMALPGVTRPPKGIFKWLLVLGPGLVAAMAGDDAGGVATYSQAGAGFGYELLWVLAIITVSLAVVQEMSS